MDWRRQGGRAAVGLAVGAFLLGVGGLRADDWPQWLGPKHDGIWRETGIVDKFPEKGLTVKWRAPVSGGYAGPAVAGGRVYVTDRVLPKDVKPPADPFGRGQVAGSERVLCLNEADGKEIWKYEYDCPYAISYQAGPRTTPVVADGKVFTLGAMGDLLCLSSERGGVVWKRDLKKDYNVKAPMWGFSAHPLLDGKKLICMVGGAGSTVVAFDKDTGKELWKALTAKEPGYCPPMIYQAGGKRQLIVWHAESVNGLDPETGQVYWTQALAPDYGMAIATPRLEGDRLFLTAIMSHSMLLKLAADKPAAEVVWTANKKQSMFCNFGTPFVEGGYAYGPDNDGQYLCVKLDTGARVWGTVAPIRGPGKKPVKAANAFTVKNGDRFFLAGENGDLIIAKLNPKGYEEVSRAHFIGTTNAAFGRDVVWSHPAFANRRVYARNDKELVCVDLSAPAGGR